MMIFLAIAIVAFPIVTMIYFIAYKIWLHYHVPSIVTVQPKQKIIEKKDDDEITLVITKAINMYLKQ